MLVCPTFLQVMRFVTKIKELRWWTLMLNWKVTADEADRLGEELQDVSAAG